jgi:GNAT superfamily N-acetyltransferase
VARRVEAFAADPASQFLVAEAEGRVAGLAAATVLPLAHEDGASCRLSALVVAAQSRRAGLGRALVQAVEAFARSRGCDRVEVTSGERPERDPAHRFYRRSATSRSRGAS